MLIIRGTWHSVIIYSVLEKQQAPTSEALCTLNSQRKTVFRGSLELIIKHISAWAGIFKEGELKVLFWHMKNTVLFFLCILLSFTLTDVHLTMSENPQFMTTVSHFELLRWSNAFDLIVLVHVVNPTSSRQQIVIVSFLYNFSKFEN